MIELDSVSFSYGSNGGAVEAVSDLDLRLEDGSFVAVIGSNGCGKSTFAKLLNAILVPSKGTVRVDGLDTRDPSNIYAIRSKVGLVFQNPDNQLVSDTVEDDIVFGLENMGLPRHEMEVRLEETLSLTGLTPLRHCSPDRLSGGQKQLVAIAGILAMRPKCIVLDEATSMLDPAGRATVLGLCHDLNERLGMTIVLVTHYMDECIDAHRIVAMDRGTVRLDGTPSQVFARADELKALGVGLPIATELAEGLIARGIGLPHGILTGEELCRELLSLKSRKDHGSSKGHGSRKDHGGCRND